MPTRRLDGLYRTYEPDPELVNRIAVDLLTRAACSISTTRAAVELLQDYPELAYGGFDDDTLDDLRDAIYQACARAVITIPNADAG
jgi:hypothetical protein